MTPTAMLLERIVSALADLVTASESVDDEWIYVHDLETVWVARLRAIGAERITDPPAGASDAIDELIAETHRITDPHRAIDWLSTLPQAALIAIGEDAW
ncbi:MAG: hypothetical protein ABI573_11840 [Chloroflexota bacterium]